MLVYSLTTEILPDCAFFVLDDQPFDLGENDHILQCLMAEQSSSPPSLFLAHGGIGETAVSYASKSVVTSSGSGGGGRRCDGDRGGRSHPRPRPCDPAYGR